MARAAVADGIAALAATPHAGPHRPQPNLAERVAELQAALDAHEIALRLLVGAEIALSPDVTARLSDRTLPTLAGSRYALVELPFNLLPPNVDQTLYEMQLAGFTPVMAHVERYRFVHGSPERLAEWAERGVILQLNAGSLRGDFGSSPRRVAEEVVGNDWPAILASDAHDSRRRKPQLAFARALAIGLADEARAAELLDAGPAAIASNLPFPTPAPRSPAGALVDGPGPLGRLLRRLRDG